MQSTARQANGVELARQLLIVPDHSMVMPYRAAWMAKASEQHQAFVMPELMTLMDWAKRNGAQDWDAQNTERTLQWMNLLPTIPAFSVMLGAQEQGESVDYQALARRLIAMSDELSIHLLPGRNLHEVKRSIEQVIHQLYRRQTHTIAQQELAVLLAFWQADVDAQTPVIQYLNVLQTMCRQHQNTSERPYDTVWVLLNRAWTAHEQYFWQRYARYVPVNVLDIQSVPVLAGADRQAAIQKIAGQSTPRWSTSDSSSSSLLVQIYAAQNLEDEAQTAVRQVLAWRAQGLRQIALVALDRQVSRRVWALLQRVNIPIQDDTGWLLSTSRAASAWWLGLQLMQGEVLAKDLCEWWAHPLVGSALELTQKQHSLDQLYAAADAQQGYRGKHVWRHWSDWIRAVQQLEGSTELLQWLKSAQTWERRWKTQRSLQQWSQEFIAWAKAFQLWSALEQDAAGQVWCDLMSRWQWVADETPLSLATFLRLMNTDVESLTYRPTRQRSSKQDDGEITLMPLGNTRLRMFDAVWLLGADAANLPGSEQDLGLLNTRVRRELGLPTVEDKHMQMRIALLDILALNPQVVASYTRQKEGTPNALSPWLQQYQRAVELLQPNRNVESTPAIVTTHTLPVQSASNTILPRSSISIAQHLPPQISATDLNSIAACPYQYYAKRVLKIAPLDWANDDVLASDQGNLWHRIIELFHQKHQINSSLKEDETVFLNVMDQLLTPLCAENPRYWTVREIFETYATPFVAWWQAREQQGWQVASSEYAPKTPVQQVIINDAGETVHQVRWHGRIDQIDQRTDDLGEQQWSLIDYKTNTLQSYKQRIRDDEETQLAFYINLVQQQAEQSQAQIVDARYVGVDKKNSHSLPEAYLGDATQIKQQAKQLREQVHQLFLHMSEGAPLVAFGEKSACVYCDYRAVCRKDYTVDSASMYPREEAR